jgi:hypothetical protein
MKEVLGDEWKNVNTHRSEVPFSSSGVGIIYDDSAADPFSFGGGEGATVLSSGEIIFKPVYISLFVYPDTAIAEGAYLDTNKGHKGNEINIGDTGNIYTLESDTIIKVTFRKNNIISNIYLSPYKSELFNVDMAVKLAKKQDEKISRILEIIQ